MPGEVNLAELERVLRDRFWGVGEADQGSGDAITGANSRTSPRRAVGGETPGSRRSEWVLASALAGGAELLVTGDQDLLEVLDRVSLPIVNPRGCWERLRQPG